MAAVRSISAEAPRLKPAGDAAAPWRFARRLPGPRDPWTADSVLAAIGAWTVEVGRAPRSYEWAPSTARDLSREQSDGVQKWIREQPRWPSASTVRRYWGCR